jgi:spermidine synthase
MAKPTERVVIARHTTFDGEIQLQRRLLPDDSWAFEIIANGVFLMASYNQISERALASYTLKAMGPCPCSKLRVLIGGLGMGFTLQQILANKVTSVDVVEISPHIIAWNRTHLVSVNDDVLADPRVKLIQGDLYTVSSTLPPASYSAILLDVDNGPSWLIHENNARLYTLDTLERWSTILMPGGALAVWSAQPEPEFLKRMKAIFGYTDEVAIVEPNHKNEPTEYFIYYGLKGSSS